MKWENIWEMGTGRSPLKWLYNKDFKANGKKGIPRGNSTTWGYSPVVLSQRYPCLTAPLRYARLRKNICDFCTVSDIVVTGFLFDIDFNE